MHHSSSLLSCKICFDVSTSKEEWTLHMMNKHDLSCTAAMDGIMILDEAHTVLQNSEPTRLRQVEQLVNLSQEKSRNAVVIKKETE